MRTVLLRLCGPLQSWGTQGRYGIRDTDREPSKSGVLGLVGAALGMPRDDTKRLEALRRLSMAVRVDREGKPLSDFHSVGGGRFLSEPHGIWSIEKQRKEEKTALTQRHYLADASFLVALGGEDHELVDAIASALANPKWPLFLGRRSCPPAEPVFAGVVDGSPEDAVRQAPIRVDPARKDEDARVRIVLAADAVSGRPRQDDPVSYALYERAYGLRYVRMEFIPYDALPKEGTT